MTQPFTSLHYPFAIDEAQGRIRQETDFDQHILQLIMQVLMTAPGERVHRPDLGCGVKRLVFAPGGEIAALLARSVIHQSLSRWLPNAISLQDVGVQARDATLQIRLVYVVRTSGERRFLNLDVAP